MKHVCLPQQVRSRARWNAREMQRETWMRHWMSLADEIFVAPEEIGEPGLDDVDDFQEVKSRYLNRSRQRIWRCRAGQLCLWELKRVIQNEKWKYLMICAQVHSIQMVVLKVCQNLNANWPTTKLREWDFFKASHKNNSQITDSWCDTSSSSASLKWDVRAQVVASFSKGVFFLIDFLALGTLHISLWSLQPFLCEQIDKYNEEKISKHLFQIDVLQ